MKKSIPGFTVSTCLLVIPFFLVTIGNLQAQSPSRVTLEKLAVYPTLIVYNGKVGTMDNNLTTYQAMAIRGDRIWTLGTDREIRQLAGPQTQMIDLKGRTVVPGLIDVHTHPHLWAWWHYGGQVLPQLEPAYAHGKNFEEVRRNLELVIQQRIQRKGPMGDGQKQCRGLYLKGPMGDGQHSPTNAGGDATIPPTWALIS